MALSNLPPGCSSADGGLDLVLEKAIDDLVEAADGQEDVIRLFVKIAPAVLEALNESYFEGWDLAFPACEFAEQD
jgi:hypothetical protein